jgi:hypothetical protein
MGSEADVVLRLLALAIAPVTGFSIDQFSGDVSAIETVFNRIIECADKGAEITLPFVGTTGFVGDFLKLIRRCRSYEELHEMGLRALLLIYSFDWPDIRISFLCHGMLDEILDALRAHESSSIHKIELVGRYSSPQAHLWCRLKPIMYIFPSE